MRAGVALTSSGDPARPVDDDALARLALVRNDITTAATLAHERTLPVVDDLRAIFPGGAIQRGSTMSLHGIGATSLALASVAEAVRRGSFLAVVAPRTFSLAACLDFDIPLRRVVQFDLSPNPSEGQGKPEAARWPQLVAAIIEGFDVVVLADRHRLGASQARQLVARNRERGSVLVRVGGPAWPEAADVRFDLHQPQWSGLGAGHGHLRTRRVEVAVAGRRWHGGHRRHALLLPAALGGVERSTGIERAAGIERSAESERFAGADIDALIAAADHQVTDHQVAEHDASRPALRVVDA